MKLTLQLRLLPDPKQSSLLLETMLQFNAAASFAANVGFKAGVFCQPSIHFRCYHELRSQFKLSAQMAVRAIGKAVETFKRDKSICPVFKPHGAVTYDERIFSFKGVDKVSLWTLAGRVIFPLVYGQYQSERFDRIKGQADLVYRDGKFFLLATVDLPEQPPVEITQFLGVDLGIANLAADSDGKIYSGSKVEVVRTRFAATRKRLQRRASKGAKKLLRKLMGKEARFRRHENHCISKSIVQCAKDTNRGVALEDLTGLRATATVRRKQRARHSSWAYHQLRAFIEYKAKLAGVLIKFVKPWNSSRTCSRCGHCEKSNRKSQAEFRCTNCGFECHADFNAALNLAAWAACKPTLELAEAPF